MTLFTWSKTAGSNDTADATINWQEGQAPSTVNNSARAMMAAVAKWRDDLAGITTGGTSTAYTIATNEVYTSLAALDGKLIVFSPHVTNGGNPTLNVDGLGAKLITGTNGLNPGVLQAGMFYLARYTNASNQFFLYGYYDQANYSPIGTVLPFAGSTNPNAFWFMCNGQAISRSTYASLFTIISTTYGVGDGSTTFNVPDLRGRVAAGVDNMGGASAAGRISSLVTDSGTITGTSLASTGGSQSHTQTGAEAGTSAHGHGITDPQHAHSYTVNISPNGAATVGGNGFISQAASTTGSAATGITINNAVAANASSAMAILQPTIMLNYIIRAI